ncbi:hypothetical protein Pcinc_043857 [Petrolisthes cinctipes]|uniref:Uncharacterized protein n=1 Tax=Petrolisthes cinctipes TaxID=88211 RepID=A0AAE1EER4_PETCI|nr:hypothetical protein Pcinc_043857 [Petrolisthes cinctipes]
MRAPGQVETDCTGCPCHWHHHTSSSGQWVGTLPYLLLLTHSPRALCHTTPSHPISSHIPLTAICQPPHPTSHAHTPYPIHYTVTPLTRTPTHTLETHPPIHIRSCQTASHLEADAPSTHCKLSPSVAK